MCHALNSYRRYNRDRDQRFSDRSPRAGRGERFGDKDDDNVWKSGASSRQRGRGGGRQGNRGQRREWGGGSWNSEGNQRGKENWSSQDENKLVNTSVQHCTRVELTT